LSIQSNEPQPYQSTTGGFLCFGVVWDTESPVTGLLNN